MRSKYIKIIKSLMNILKRARIPFYLHKKSNHIYNTHQHIILLTLMQYERKSYRRFIEFLKIADDIRSILKLDKIPHYTTLNKFLIKIKGSILYKIISSFIINTRIKKIRAAMDGTGFKDGNASSYYTYRSNLRKRYLKLSLIIDIDKQLVLALKRS